MRRAMRNARMLGTVDPYLHKLTGFVAEHMRDAYPEMMESIPRVARVVKDEEHRYATTFMVAEKVFHDEAKHPLEACCPARHRSSYMTRTAWLLMNRKKWLVKPESPSTVKVSTRKWKSSAPVPALHGGCRQNTGQPHLSIVTPNRIRWPRDAGSSSSNYGHPPPTEPRPQAASRTAKSYWIELPSTPKPAARSVILACSCRRKRGSP